MVARGTHFTRWVTGVNCPTTTTSTTTSGLRYRAIQGHPGPWSRPSSRATLRSVSTDPRPAWGLFGGAFDPPHLGHLAVAAVALAAGALERLVVVPCFDHPLGKRMAPWEDRLAMCRLAFVHLARVDVSAIESELPSPSLTLRTLETLAARRPDVRWRLVIGSDTLADRSQWHRFDDIVRLAEPLVVGRAGHADGPGSFAVPDLSSSEIRSRLAASRDVRGWLDPAVLHHLIEKDLYRPGDGSSAPAGSPPSNTSPTR